MKLAEIKDLDAALVVGSFLRKDHPLFAQRLRRTPRRAPVSLLSVTADDQLINFHQQQTAAPAQLASALAAGGQGCSSGQAVGRSGRHRGCRGG